MNGTGEVFGSTSIVSSPNEREFPFPSSSLPNMHTNEADFGYLSLPPTSGDPINLFLPWFDTGLVGAVTWEFTGLTGE